MFEDLRAQFPMIQYIYLKLCVDTHLSSKKSQGIEEKNEDYRPYHNMLTAQF